MTTVFGTEVTAVRGAATHLDTPDPAAAVDVLVPLAERNALAAARVERQQNGSGSARRK